MQVPIKEVIIKNRIRKNLGDLTSLMESISKYGLMNPIIINSKKELIAGHRRLESCRRLGWESIQVRVVTSIEETGKLEMEIDENLHRKNLSPDELAEAYLRLEHLREPNFLKNLWQKFVRLLKRIFKKKSTPGFPEITGE